MVICMLYMVLANVCERQKSKIVFFQKAKYKTILSLLLVLFVFCSCAVTHETTVRGKTTVITTDTTVIYHSGNGNVNIRTPVK